MKKGIQAALLVAIIGLSYLVYNSIQSKVEFETNARARRDVVVENLIDIRTAEIAYKTVKGYYANNFDSLLDCIKNDSFLVILQKGDLEDSVAVAHGLVTRDTSFVSIRDSIFAAPYPLDSMRLIPFGDNEEFVLDAGEVEKGKVKVKVFMAFANYGAIYNNLNTKNENIDFEEGLQVGSMTETSTSGNWE
ncbi:MAG: hypothetical protein HRT72_00715 [Flavobacteriales bacterium]|nr:hypothetical protein [Flavobacteriales bacterium]